MNMTNNGRKVYIWVAAIIAVVLICLSWKISGQIEKPASWLSDWTAWIAAYATLVIGIGSAVELIPRIARNLRYKVGIDGKVIDLKSL